MKQKKVTIKPFLNKRLRSAIFVESSNGNNTEIEKWLLYYEVIYNRKNTQLPASYGKESSDFTKYYYSIEDSDYNYKNPSPIIKRDTETIVQIIRMKELLEKDFSVVGLKKYYEEYSVSLHHLVNRKLNKYLSQKLVVKLKGDIASLFNFSNGCFYSIYKYTDILFPNDNLFSQSERSKFELLKSFFELYNTNSNGPRKIKHLIGIPTDTLVAPCYIDLLSGKLNSDLLSMGMSSPKTQQLINLLYEIVAVYKPTEL